MNSRLSHVVAAVYDRPWFIRQQSLAIIDGIVRMHVAGERLSSEEIRERVEAASGAAGPRGGARTLGAVGVIPVYGPIMPRATLMSEYSGGTSIESLRNNFREAMADEAVGSILLEFDSPGGYTDGVDELAQEIREARGQGKAIVAISNYTMASAAYYLGSQADEVVASPSSEVGWIGTVLVHQEFSRMDEIDGVTTTIIRNPAGKYGGNQFEPLSDKARGEFQELIDERSAQFHAAVSKGRGVPVARVKSDFGQGGGMTAARAKAAGLVDRVESFDATVRRLATGRGPVSRGTSATGVRIQHYGADGQPISTAEAITQLQTDPTAGFVIQGGDATPADDPEADAAGEAGTPPDPTREAEAALALARAQARR